MNKSITQIHRFESPTSVLQVWTERSPLSVWTSSYTAKNLRFNLKINHGDKRKTIRGNQRQFEHLIESISAYVDSFLDHDYVVTFNHIFALSPALEVGSESLKPRSGRYIKLSTLELFDLLNNFEQCASEIFVIPTQELEMEIKNIATRWQKLAAIATVGITISVIRLFLPAPIPQPQYSISSNLPASNLPKDRRSNIPAIVGQNEARQDLGTNRKEDRRNESPKSSSKISQNNIFKESKVHKERLDEAIKKINPAQARSLSKIDETPKSNTKNDLPQSKNLALADKTIPANDANGSLFESKPSLILPSRDNQLPPAPISPNTSSSIDAPRDLDGKRSLESSLQVPNNNAPAAPVAQGNNVNSRSFTPETANLRPRLEGRTSPLVQSGLSPSKISSKVQVAELKSSLNTDLKEYQLKIEAMALSTNTKGEITLEVLFENDELKEIKINQQKSTIKDKEVLDVVQRSLFNIFKDLKGEMMLNITLQIN